MNKEHYLKKAKDFHSMQYSESEIGINHLATFGEMCVNDFFEDFEKILSDISQGISSGNTDQFHQSNLKLKELLNDLKKKEEFKAPNLLMVFSNGQVAAFDKDEEQMGDIQGYGWMSVYFDFLEKRGVKPDKIPEIIAQVNGSFRVVKPFYDEDLKQWRSEFFQSKKISNKWKRLLFISFNWKRLLRLCD